jgi:hypothetical protein
MLANRSAQTIAQRIAVNGVVTAPRAIPEFHARELQLAGKSPNGQTAAFAECLSSGIVVLFQIDLDCRETINSLGWNQPFSIGFVVLDPFPTSDVFVRAGELHAQERVALRSFVAVKWSIRAPNTSAPIRGHVSAFAVAKAASKNLLGRLLRRTVVKRW